MILIAGRIGARMPLPPWRRCSIPMHLSRRGAETNGISPERTTGQGCGARPGRGDRARAPRSAIGTRIGANAVIGPGVAIGHDCEIGSNVTISHAYIGDRVTILPGAAIGQPGFGFASSAGGHVKIPQLGRVIIQDGVEIGAATTIDRGALGDTVIGEGTKIDNLVQIGHNVQIGRHVRAGRPRSASPAVR